MWVPPEIKDPVLLHAPTRKSVGYFGAVRLRDGKLFTMREEHKFDGQSFWEFLIALRRRALASGRRVVLICDNARYHHATLHKEWREVNHKRFALHFLPPYSPELNPIERIWKLVRRLRIHNQHFPLLDDLLFEVEDQFHQWRHPNETLRRLCTITKGK